MNTPAIRVRARWLDGRVETLDPMPSGVETQELRGLGQDLRWYSFRHAGEIDEDGFLIFVQGAEPVSDPPISTPEIIDFTAQCSDCGKVMEIVCNARHGFEAMNVYAVHCPYCSATSRIPLPDDHDIVEVRRL